MAKLGRRGPTLLYEAMKTMWEVDWSTHTGLAYKRRIGTHAVGAPVGWMDADMGGYCTSFQGRVYEMFRILVYLIQDVDIEGRRIIPLSEFGPENIDPHRIPNKINPTTGLRGVRYDKHGKRYHASICVDNKVRFLASYKTKEAAARRYNEEAILLFGDKAQLNELD